MKIPRIRKIDMFLDLRDPGSRSVITGTDPDQTQDPDPSIDKFFVIESPFSCVPPHPSLHPTDEEESQDVYIRCIIVLS
jgi:hypothetical protein